MDQDPSNLYQGKTAAGQSLVSVSFVIPMTDIEYEAMSDRLGEGSFGIVYKARWRHSAEPVAVKKFKGHFSDHAVQEFHREMQLMARLNSPYIVRFFGVCTGVQEHAMVMEFMPHGSLYHLLHKEDSLPWSLRQQIASDIGYALQYLHDHKILHRELKSLNVLLDAQLKAKIADFGLSRIKLESRMTSKARAAAAGSLPWMAPELFRRNAENTSASDVYSYGVTLWELASRRLPFSDAQDPSLIQNWVIQGEREAVPADCPEAFGQLIRRCWDQDPSQRPSIGEVVVILQQLPAPKLEAYPPPPAYSRDFTPDYFPLVHSSYQNQLRPGAEEANLRGQVQEQVLSSQIAALELQLQEQQAQIQQQVQEAVRQVLGAQEGQDPQRDGIIIQRPERPLPSASLLPAVGDMQSRSLAALHLDMRAERASRHAHFQQFLQHIAYGEQDEAAHLLQVAPELVYGRGNVTDYSGRRFQGVTAFQYAVWALDWHMWSMLRHYLPDTAAAEQLREWKAAPQHSQAQGWHHNFSRLLRGWSSASQHSVAASWHYSCSHLLQAYKTYLKHYDRLYKANNHEQLEALWVGGVGEAQRLSPAHVLLEYTTSSRPLAPIPDFNQPGRPVDHNEYGVAWAFRGGEGPWLGEYRGCAHFRWDRDAVESDSLYGPGLWAVRDMDAIQRLSETRNIQLRQLCNQLFENEVQSNLCGIKYVCS